MSKIPYQKEELQKWCEESDSYNEVLIKSGRTKSGSNREVLKKYIALYNIDVSHFSSSTRPKKTKKSSPIIEGIKKCSQCGMEKDAFKDFYWSNGHTRSVCKECVKENERQRYKEIKQKFIDYKKTLKCKKCGENRFYLLDFHHRNPDEKEYTISDKARVSIENIMKEIDKCDILCSNCHREWHYFLSNEIITNYQDWINN